MNKNKTIWFEVCLCSLIWGLVPVGIKLIEGSPLTIGLLRLAVGLPCFLLIPRTFGILKKTSSKDLPVFFGLGLFFFLHWGSYFYSIQISDPTTAVLGLSTYGIHLMYLSFFFLGRKPRLVDLSALGLALLGVIIIVPDFSLTNETSYGLFWGILGGFFFAVLPLIHKKNQHIDDLLRAFMMLLIAFVLFLVSSLSAPWKTDIANDWLWLLFLGSIGTFVSHTLWTRISTYFSTNLTSILYYLFIPVTMIWSWIILAEIPGPEKLVGGGLIILGGLLSITTVDSVSEAEDVEQEEMNDSRGPRKARSNSD